MRGYESFFFPQRPPVKDIESVSEDWNEFFCKHDNQIIEPWGKKWAKRFWLKMNWKFIDCKQIKICLISKTMNYIGHSYASSLYWSWCDCCVHMYSKCRMFSSFCNFFSYLWFIFKHIYIYIWCNDVESFVLINW